MATTRFISMHIGKGKTIAKSISDRNDYAKNPNKTQDGELVSSYGCDPRTVDEEFLLAKRQYKAITGREQARDKDVLAYQIRQSFKPGEVTPAQANAIGYEMAMRFTKGNHDFIVATHVDKKHIHSHIIFNSTTRDCTHKFVDFLGSGRAVRRLSDRLCLEHGLSIIENPKRGGKHYGKWLGDKHPLSWQDKLRQVIDNALAEKPKDFDDLLKMVQAAGYEMKRGKLLKFRAPGQTNFTKLRSLGTGYSEQELRDIIDGRRSLAPGRKPVKVNLLVDIQAKLNAGKGAGYERWAKVFNLKQAAQTLNFLQEHGLLEYAQLEARAAQATTSFNALTGRMKGLEGRLADVAKLRNHIIQYSKTREVYAGYRKAGYSKKYLAEHEADILRHKAAKATFDELGVEKLPTVKSLQAEYSRLLAEKNKIYGEYKKTRAEMRELLTAKENVDRLLGMGPAAQRPEQEKGGPER